MVKSAILGSNGLPDLAGSAKFGIKKELAHQPTLFYAKTNLLSRQLFFIKFICAEECEGEWCGSCAIGGHSYDISTLFNIQFLLIGF